MTSLKLLVKFPNLLSYYLYEIILKTLPRTITNTTNFCFVFLFQPSIFIIIQGVLKVK